MFHMLPKDLNEELGRALRRSKHAKSRMRVQAGDRTFTILRLWETGFALDAEDAPHMRGLVDIYDGARHISQCLIVTSSEVAGERVFEFKRATPALDQAPRDYVRDESAPVALLTNG